MKKNKYINVDELYKQSMFFLILTVVIKFKPHAIGLSGRKQNLKKKLKGTPGQMYIKTKTWYCLRQKYVFATTTKFK